MRLPAVAGQAAAATGLLLNFFPATFSADALPAFAGPYGDDGAFRRLVAEEDGWTAWRDRDDGGRVYVWRHDEDAAFARAGFRPVTVALDENAPIFCRVMLDGIDRHLRGRGFARLGRGGYANWEVGNFLNDLGLTNFEPDPRVGLYPKIVLESFMTRFGEDGPLVGLVVDLAHTTRLDVPVDELLADGFEVRGRYVKVRPGVGGPAEAEGRLAGRVAGVERGQLVLDDRREGVAERVDAALCVLRPDRPTLYDYLRWRHPDAHGRVRAALDGKFAHFNSPSEKLRLIERFPVLRLVPPDGGFLPVAAGLGVRFGEMTGPKAGAARFPSAELQAPTYSFDPESPKTHASPDGGIRQHGPYSRARMRGWTPRVLVLAPEAFKGQVEQFVDRFRCGIRGSEFTYNGFGPKYRLDGLEVVERYFPWAGGPAKDAYYNAAVAALEDSTEYDLCFVVVREDFKALAPADGPYHVCKALLLSFGITVQDILVETIRSPERNLQWTLNTIALAVYAKMGGTPFVLKARQVRHHELVFGIGRSVDRAHGSRLGPTEQVIGFTTVFRSDGDYLLNSCTPYTDMARYERALEEVVLRAVEEVAASEGIADGETIRLVFHVFKQTGRREVGAIRNAIAKLTRYRVEFALLHVNDSHRFRLFDRANEGGPNRRGDWDTATALIPPRRAVVELGPRQRLVNFVGPQQYRRRGTPTPLLLTLDRASTFVDLDYLTQQAYEFSFMSWRTFNPGVKPVTVFYAELMAGLNSRLRQVAPWNQELVRTKLRRKLWFI